MGDRETKRKLASKKKLRIDEILEERSAIPAVRARVVAAAASAAATTAASKKRKAPTGAKQAMKKAKTAERVVREVPVKPLDIWDDSDALKTVSVVPAGIDPVTAEYLEPLFVKPVKKPETMVKPKIASALPAIAVAHPGASYNPVCLE